MSNSTIDGQSGDGGFDIGSSIDDLFGEIEDESDLDDGIDRSSRSEDSRDSDAVEDQTAANVFGQLKSDEAESADSVLDGATPEEIIASADEPDPLPGDPIDDDLLADEDELEELLLTGRTKDQEFLWIETDESDVASESEAEPETDGEIGESSEAPDGDQPESAVSASTATAAAASDATTDANDTDDESASIEDDPRDIEQIIADRTAKLEDEPAGRSTSTAEPSADDSSPDDGNSVGLFDRIRSLLPF